MVNGDNPFYNASLKLKYYPESVASERVYLNFKYSEVKDYLYVPIY